jgi:molybdopterin-guanine dinucleotide biosynthesis protein A
MTAAAIYGLILSGGRSRRMQRDKAGLEYDGKPQLRRAFELLRPLVTKTFISVRADQQNDPVRAPFESITDRVPDLGPIGGIHAAMHAYPDHAWLILACDLPFLDTDSLHYLIARRAPTRLATAFRSSFDGLPEPLCCIFEPQSGAAIDRWIAQGQKCPRALLSASDVELLDLPHPQALDNINTVDEYSVAQATLRCGRGAPLEQHSSQKRLNVRYFAMLREQAGRTSEDLHTQAATPMELYEELRQRYGLSLAPHMLRVAVNDEFGDWRVSLCDGDRVAFLPPVAGG